MPAVAEVTVYVKSSCSKCRAALALLRERGVEPLVVEYEVTGLARDEVRELVRRTGAPAAALLREPAPEGASDDEVIALLMARPELLQRPVVVRGERAVVARPPERLLELF